MLLLPLLVSALNNPAEDDGLWKQITGLSEEVDGIPKGVWCRPVGPRSSPQPLLVAGLDVNNTPDQKSERACRPTLDYQLKASPLLTREATLRRG